MKLYFKNSITLFSTLIFSFILICSHQIAKADPFDILFGPATYTNGSQSQTFSIICGDNVTLPSDSGGTLTFVVYSYSTSISNIMFLSSGPLPPGATFPSAWGMTYVQSTFTWTPTVSFFGNIVFQLRGTADVDCIISFDWSLPVDLTSFTSYIYRNNVSLIWQTSSEYNNSKFLIERTKKINGNFNDWSLAGSIPGNGTTTSSSDYTFTDRDLNSGIYQYRLKQVDFNGNFRLYSLRNNVLIGSPEKFELSQNYPNPFNPSTKINFDLPFDSKVKISVFDMAGREVDILVNELKQAGFYSVDFNASGLSSGIYYYTVSAGSFIATKKMTLIK